VQVSADDIIGELNNGLPLIQSVVDDGLLAICAEAVGAMEVLYKTTVEYTKQRKQFDVAIGSFQALQHRMVDMFIEHEQSKSLMFLAAMRLAEGSDEASKAISALKVQIGKGGRYVGQQAVQLHGGMGQTEELNVGHYFKRLTMISHTFGNADFHLNRFGEL
jgi:alkylation response protein AidB-like acyl-CoA dehydrogenase